MKALEEDVPRLLSAAPLFAHLRSEELDVLSQYSEVLPVAQNDIIFTPGSPGDALFIVSEGEVTIRRRNDAGEDVDVARFIEGDSFGELDLLRNAERRATARATQAGYLVRFPRRNVSFQSVLEAQPVIHAQVLYKLLGQISGRIRNTNKVLSENTPWVQNLRNEILSDNLTGLYNNTYLDEDLPSFLEQQSGPVTLLMVKPDNFKAVNDTYGHDAGDETLKRMAARLRELLPEDAVAIRYRGNELAAVVPQTSGDGACRLAYTLRDALQTLEIDDLTDPHFALSVSVGLATYPDDSEDPETLVALAHKRVFAGRDAGGSRVIAS
jgi:diguanylate cyclase (GGDEF)-like protein